MLTADELLQQIQDATQVRNLAKAKIDSLKKQILYAESDLIEANLIIEKATEDFQRYHDATVHADFSAKALEIMDFQNRFPQLCEMARLRDLKGDKNGTGSDS
jgi:hypothetical protein